MIHLDTKVREIVKTLQKGFNGVYLSAKFSPYPTREEVVPSEMTDEAYDKQIRDYASFVAEPDFHCLTSGLRENDYLDVDILKGKFEDDLKAYIQKEVGDDVKITYYPGCFEYELQRGNPFAESSTEAVAEVV